MKKIRPTKAMRAEMDVMHRLIGEAMAPLMGERKLLALRIDALLHTVNGAVVTLSDTLMVHPDALAMMDKMIEEFGIERSETFEVEQSKTN